MRFNPSEVAYRSPAGAQVFLDKPEGDLPPITFSVNTVGVIHEITVESSDESKFKLDETRWQPITSLGQYAKQNLIGRTACVLGKDASTTLSAYIKTASQGTISVRVTFQNSRFTEATGVFPKSATRGNETLRIEEQFAFATDRSCTYRLVRIYGDNGPERTIIRSGVQNFPANTPVIMSEPIAFSPVTGRGKGYEYVWEIDVSPEQVSRSMKLPIWVIGSAAPVANPDAAPASLALPAIYQRPASNYGKVIPNAGYTYQNYLDRFIYYWKAQNLWNPVGGAWLSFAEYFANIYYVDLNDTTIPKYTFKQWDVFNWGWVPGGWYGVDSSAWPFPRSNVAVDIPVPDNAAPSVGTDRALCIVGMRNGVVEKVWEMWLAMKNGDGSWQAASIGVTDRSQNLRHSKHYTCAASGISAAAYGLRVKEAKLAVNYVRTERAAGRIPSEDKILEYVPHVLAINMPYPFMDSFSYPATFTDGSDTNPTTPWEGQVIYLRQDFDVAAQNYYPLGHVIAVVAKRRGMMVTDRTAHNTSMIVEGDQAYGGGVWETLRDPNESWIVKFPDDAFVIGKQYLTQAEFDADTVVSSTSASAAPNGVDGSWNLIFSDEFNGTTLDSNVWLTQRGLEPGTYGHPWNADSDDYSFVKSYATVEGGNLKLRWDHTPSTVTNNDGSTTTYNWSCGMVHSAKGFSYSQGFLEARIYITNTIKGIWPAFWLLPMPVNSWPPEIDIAEWVQDGTPDGIYHPHFNYHWNDSAGVHQQFGWKWYGTQGVTELGGWHTYGLLWETGKLQAFLDGQPGPAYYGPTPDTYKMYPVLSTGVEKDSSPADGEMLVDYIRAWQR